MSVYLMTLDQLAVARFDSVDAMNAWNERVSALAAIERELQNAIR